MDQLINKLYSLAPIKMTNFENEVESKEYQACFFKINSKFVRYRHAKVTPTKNGQFVTIWKREGQNPIQPYDCTDDIDLLVVTVKTKNQLGQFVFPKSALIKYGVLSVNGKDGKRALRVYPPWDKPESNQALKSQKWQLEFFIEIPKNKSIDVQRFKTLYTS